MAGLVMRWIVSSFAIWLAARLFEDVILLSDQDALVSGAVLALVASIARPILVLLALPVNIATLGIFCSLTSFACLWFGSSRIPGLTVHGFPITVVSAVMVGVVCGVVTDLLRGGAGYGRS